LRVNPQIQQKSDKFRKLFLLWMRLTGKGLLTALDLLVSKPQLLEKQPGGAQ
jgi:hypothetical protein